MGNLNFLDRAIGAVSPQKALQRVMAGRALKMFDEGHEPGWGSKVRGSSASATDQASSEGWRKQRERITAIWDGRAMEENLCVIAGLLDKIAMYTVGELEYQSMTGDKGADREYEEYFHGKCATIDITGRFRLRTLAEIGVRSMFRDGEHGWVERMVDGEYKLQAIEADRIGNPNNPSQDETNIGGIKIDQFGRPTSYQIHRRTRTNQYELEGEVPPERFIHLMRATRSDQYHGVSILKPVIPHARDLYELLGFEKVAAKFAASFAGFLQTADPFDPNGAMSWDTAASGNGKAPAAMNVAAGTLQKVGRGDNVLFAPGTQRPSGAFIALIQAIFREIAMGTTLPYGFIYDMAMFGGVTARLETQQADRVFRRFRRMLIDTFLDRVKRKVLLLGIAKKEIRAVKDWNKGAWNFGASLTGDIGHQVQADSTMIQMGVKTRTQWAAELGYDYNDLVDQTAAEIANLQRVSAEKNIPLELLSSSLPSPTASIAAMAKAKAGISDEPPPPPGLVGSIGEKGAKGVTDLLAQVGQGLIDRESARNTLVTVYGMEPGDAQSVLPG